MYTITTCTHIVANNKLQALVTFTYKGRDELAVCIVDVNAVGTDLQNVYSNNIFIDACNAAIAAKKTLIDNPIIL